MLSQAQQELLKAEDRSLDIEVREEMEKILDKELVRYVDELLQGLQSDSVAASGDSRDLLEAADDEELLDALLGMCGRN